MASEAAFRLKIRTDAYQPKNGHATARSIAGWVRAMPARYALHAGVLALALTCAITTILR